MIERFVGPVLLLTACASASVSAGQTSFPKSAGYVNDFAGVLNDGIRAELEQRLRDVETKTSSEIAVAIVTSLDGMSVEEYTNRLFKDWGVGQEKTDNGVLVVVSPSDREMRIEVGYGLEGVLPDGLSGEIIRDEFIPRFRDNDYAGGITAGVQRIADIVERNQVLTPEELARFNEASDTAPAFVLIPFMGLFVTIGSLMIGLGLRTKTGFPILFGSFFGGMPLVLSMAVLFMTTIFTLLPLAIVMALWGYRLGGRASWRNAVRTTSSGGKKGGGSGWVMGGGSSGSGSSSGSSSSSSGGSFGGGSSGGGGASGKW